jgi:uncharacterized protein YkwD
MESSRGRKGIGAGRAGAVVAIVAGLVALPPAFAGEDGASAPPPDADGIVGNGTPAEPADAPTPDEEPAGAPAVAAPDDPAPEDDAASAPDDSGAGAGDARAKRGAGCANADAGADTLTNNQIERAILCLVNQERKSRNRDKLRRDGDLDSAAGKHSARMAKDNCFEHKCPGEPGLGKRIKRSGYLDGAERWRYAESLGCSKTAQKMLDAWLADDFNRTNLLSRRYADVGAGVVHGSPTLSEPVNCPDTNETGTYTLVFGWRKG